MEWRIFGETLDGAVLREGSARIGARTLLVLDISDIAKPYAQKMEYLVRVRDGSTGELAKGYWLCQVIAVENEAAAIVPLCHNAACMDHLVQAGRG